MQRYLSLINSFLSAVTGWLMMAMVALLTIDILWRSFAKPLLGMAEVSVFVMMIVIYLGLSRCEEYGGHVRLEFLLDMVGRRTRLVMVVLARALAVVAVLLLYYAVVKDAGNAFRTNDSIEGMISLPIWPTKFVMVIGATLFMLQTIVNLFRNPEAVIDGPPHDRGLDAH